MIVVFDLMDTLLADPYRAAHEQASGLTFEQFETRRPPGLYHRFERGEIHEAHYWAGLRDAGIDFDIDLFHQVRRDGYQWLEGMRELLADCSQHRRTVIGSNYPDWIVQVAEDFLAGLDLEVFASYQLGVRKPSDQFFTKLCDRAGERLSELVLVDDKTENADAVTRLGGLGIPATSALDVRRQLQSAGVLPS